MDSVYCAVRTESLNIIYALDSWAEHLRSIVIKQPTDASSSSIFIHALLDFAPTCFGKSLPSSGGRGFLRSYPSSLYLEVYGLRPVQSGQLSRDVTKRAQ
jgi:hypothetical protein